MSNVIRTRPAGTSPHEAHDPRRSATATPATTQPATGWQARPTTGTATRGVTAPTAMTSVVNGVTLRDYSGNPNAIAEAASVLRLVAARPDIQQRLDDKKVTLVIIPANRRMTELPEFERLRGKKTFDGRPWEDVRGSGGTRSRGRIAVGVPEEGLAQLPGNSYSEYSVALHEMAHTVHSVGLTKAERRAVKDAYQARQAAGGPWTEAYGSSNEQEYFAQGTNAWFGRNDGVGQNGAQWLRTNDPALARILESVYGPPRE